MTETLGAWGFGARLALAERSVEKELRDSVLEEVAAHCAESGECPEEAFGDPDDFAETVMNERRPDGVRAHGGDPDAAAPGGYVTAVTGQMGWMTLVMGAYLAISDGLMVPLTAGVLTGCAVVAVAVAAVHAVPHALHAGSRSRAAGWAVAALLAVLLAAVAFTQGPGTVLARLPTPALCAAGVLLLAWAVFHEPSVAPAREPEKLPSEAWLLELTRLLEARHALPRARARELAREAGRHLAEAGREAEEEFGPVAVYARRLAEAERPRRRWWLRDDVRATASTVLLSTYLVHNVYSQGQPWLTVVAAVGALSSAAGLIGHLRRSGTPGMRRAPGRRA